MELLTLSQIVILTIFMTFFISFVLYKVTFKKANGYSEIKVLIEEMISQNLFLSDNINNLNRNVSELKEEIEQVKGKNEDLGVEIEEFRNTIREILPKA